MSTQTIKKTDLRYFYNNVCKDWKLEISNLLIEQSGTTIKVPNDTIIRAYNAASIGMKKQLKKHFNIVSDDALFEVTSFEQLCKMKNIQIPILADFEKSRNPKRALALEKIQIIQEIYNGTWKPDFSDRNQQKWYPYHINEKGSWRFFGSSYCCYYWYGIVGLYKDLRTSDFVGKTFKDIYLEVI